MRKLILLLVPILAGISLFAQNETVKAEFETLVFSRHLWRGSQFGNAVTFEPSITLLKGDYRFNFWAAKTVNKSYAEVDLIFSRSFSHFSITFFDYYNPIHGEENKYFVLKDGENRHSGELTINYEANSKLPFNMMIGSFFYGDNNSKTDKPFFSTYAELSYPISISYFEIEPLLGLTTHKGYYADHFALLNSGVVARKDFNLGSNWVFPIQLSGIYNPYKNEFHFNIAVGLRLK